MDPRLAGLRQRMPQQENPYNDPSQLMNEMNAFNAEAEMDRLRAQQEQYPGSVPGGTGPTGLGANDALGWARLQQSNLAGMQAARQASGQSPLMMQSDYSQTEFGNRPSVQGLMPTQQAQRSGMALAQNRKSYLDAQDANRKRR